MLILGLNAYHGDASAALIADGQLVAAVEEERFNRIKHSAGFPAKAVQACLNMAGVTLRDVDHVAVARDPRARLLKKLVYAVRMPGLALERLRAQQKFIGLKEELGLALDAGVDQIRAKFHRVEHHKAHLASSFFVSPFEEATLLSADGLGDFASTMWGTGRGNRLAVTGAIAFPHSLGIYYTALTQYLGFWKYGDEYKVMGLAAYGEPEFRHVFSKIVQLDGKTGFNLGLKYFIHHRSGPEMTWRKGEPVLGRLYGETLTKELGPERESGGPVNARHHNVAASMQARLEDAMFSILNRLCDKTRSRNLCLAGGVAFNCSANGRIFARTPFEAVYIQPAAGDSGLAVGAAFYVWHEILGQPRSFEMRHAYWGPAFGEGTIGKALDSKLPRSGEFQVSTLPEEELARVVAQHVAEGRVVGWFQGRMEWGPRALGNRSIVADPRRTEMKDVLNSRIKHREPFRPFAPSILEERTGDFFEETHASPFMLMTYRVKPEKRSVIPAPTHVDGTGRLQTVSQEQNPRYWRLIKAFDDITGVPVVLNTSFNENEPVVCTPEEAIDCFLRTKMDVLVLDRFIVDRQQATGNGPHLDDRPPTADGGPRKR